MRCHLLLLTALLSSTTLDSVRSAFLVCMRMRMQMRTSMPSESQKARALTRLAGAAEGVSQRFALLATARQRALARWARVLLVPKLLPAISCSTFCSRARMRQRVMYMGFVKTCPGSLAYPHAYGTLSTLLESLAPCLAGQLAHAHTHA
jgi:hypothetical protein